MADFIDLVESSRWLIDRALGSSQESDDFINLETGIGGEQQIEIASPATVSNENILHALVTDESSYTNLSTNPYLSKSAEAELYLLATNFLLYVAMVIITTIIAKVYFPDSLKRGTIPKIRRKYSYRRKEERSYADAEEDALESLYSDDEDDLDSKRSASSDEHHDEHGHEHEDQEDPLLADVMGHSHSHHHPMQPLEFDQEHTSRVQVVKRLLLCSLMLNLTFVTWGALQERMLTRRYPRHTGDYFTYSYALVFSNRLWTLILSSTLMFYLKPRLSRSTVIYEYSFPSISNMLSSWCQYEALRYVSFPATTLFKSFKLGPVMLMGKLIGNKNYPAYDYFVAVVIGCGIVLFMSSTDDLRFSFSMDYLGNAEVASAKWTGVMLLCFFLFFDSFTSQFQSRLFQRHLDLSIVELMFATSAFSTVLSFITLVHENELSPAFAFVVEHSEIQLHFFVFSICSTIGQLFIFYTIKNFGAVVFTLIMTTRILLSIALSCILYGHPITNVGYLGLALVMFGVLYRIKKKAEGQHLIRWQGMDDDKGPELVHEWHEHLDM
uniref:Sugar phosphate transporter domain-containing protein n=1 Tax=Pseudo-nitzschia australis TaxID=44445 RepID=A0A7S4ALB4_9STRA|mmetsp:Transcript_24693/g.54172  ORF Transcript_24693/g.54172 Transcript_24693/m.54172 type:complete len:553 (-) Transcript_24693:734-2392(-)|eukprot:CAMPEP_0168191544 /NCGR_PEP_ID=MMETSP0139_2-20121125/17575_1 /TAXON_ID=44445 /ORGANISM="Pseudo-nitzschia australis, Strain 10249 10 AB" /LENGTH=552 /DNA_ID=CAMNT_0008114731 /DNA_START=59 /DNA_END=1717 /DNA_ORIENTATION=+